MFTKLQPKVALHLQTPVVRRGGGSMADQRQRGAEARRALGVSSCLRVGVRQFVTAQERPGYSSLLAALRVLLMLWTTSFTTAVCLGYFTPPLTDALA